MGQVSNEGRKAKSKLKTFNLDDMKGGWFVGDFVPTTLRSEECEVACKRYKAGDAEERHVHKVATEVTLVVSGRVRMNGVECVANTVVLLEPGVSSDFQALEDAVIIAVKVPSVKGDKYPAAE